MQHRVLQDASMAVGQDKAITIDPMRVFAVILHNVAKKALSHRSAPNRGPRVSAFCFLRQPQYEAFQHITATSYHELWGIMVDVHQRWPASETYGGSISTEATYRADANFICRSHDVVGVLFCCVASLGGWAVLAFSPCCNHFLRMTVEMSSTNFAVARKLVYEFPYQTQCLMKEAAFFTQHNRIGRLHQSEWHTPRALQYGGTITISNWILQA